MKTLTTYVYSLRSLVRVIDGDTLDVDLDLGFNLVLRQRIRLIGIDTPELTRPGERVAAEAAKAFTQSWLLAPGAILVQTTKDDKYGRMLGDFFRDGQLSLTAALVDAGLAKPYNP